MRQKSFSLFILMLLVFSLFPFISTPGSATATTLTLRPNAAGDSTQLTPVGDVSNYLCVDEVIADDLATYVKSVASVTLVDFYNIDDIGSFGIISSVTVYTTCRLYSATTTKYIHIGVKTNGTEGWSSQIPITTSLTEYSNVWNTNPVTSAAWSWDEIKDLQIGIKGYVSSSQLQYTQVYCKISYTKSFGASTNATTGVQEHNATLNGYNVNSTGVLTCWFQYSTDSTFTTYANSTSSIVAEHNHFSKNITGLFSGTTYYYRSCSNNSTGVKVHGLKLTFSTKPEQPTTVTAVSILTGINLSWTKGIGASYTRIQRKTGSYPTSITDGTNIYNGTGTYYVDTGATNGYTFFYKLWGFKTLYSDNTTTVTNCSYPQEPQNITGVLIVANINISWDTGRGADTTLIRKKVGVYPSSITDGTLLQNTSVDYYVDAFSSIPYCYSLWSYNATLNVYCSVYNFLFGGLRINCFDELSGDNLTFNVTISNTTGSQTYTNTSCTNTLLIDINDCPIGDHVSVYVSSINHSARIYYLDLYPNGWYMVNAYLPYTSTPPPINVSELYVCTVINEADQTLSDVHVIIKGLINGTSYYIVSDIYTDGNGRFSVWLLPSNLYKVLLNKSNYQDSSNDYIPQPPDDYGQVTGGIFKMYFETWIPTEPLYEPEHITFTGSRSGTTIFINYTDDLSHTVNTTIYLYEISPNGSETLLNTYANATSIFHIIKIGANSSRDHRVTLCYTHTDFGVQRHTLYILGVKPIDLLPPNDKPGQKINTFLTILIGYNPFGWGNFLLFFLLVAAFYYMDDRYAGVIMVFLGGIFFLLNCVFGFNSTLFTVAGGAIPTLFIVIGVMYEWIQHKKKVSS